MVSVDIKRHVYLGMPVKPPPQQLVPSTVSQEQGEREKRDSERERGVWGGGGGRKEGNWILTPSQPGQFYQGEERQTDRQTDRQTEKERDRQTDRHRDRATERERDRATERETEKERDRETEKERETDRQTETES